MDRELFDAAKDGNVGEVLRTLLAGANKNAKFGDKEETPLHTACWEGHLDAVRALLLVKADTEARDKDDCTPLHYACRQGHTEIVQTLLQVGAKLETSDDKNRYTSLHLACYFAQVKIVELLLESGARMEAKSKKGSTPLIILLPTSDFRFRRRRQESCQVPLGQRRRSECKQR